MAARDDSGRGASAVRRPEGALRRLREMRQRRRRLRAWTGLFRWLGLAGVLVWLSFALDYSLSLPVGVRGFHIVAAAVLLLIGFKVLLLAARTPISEDKLASEVESAAGDLEQALITAIQLTRPDNPRRDFYSPELLARTVDQAEARMAELRPGALLSRRRARNAFLVAAAFILPLVGGAVLRPDLTETYLERNIFLQAVDWPRSYFLRIDEPTSPRTLLAVGDSLTVQATRERGGDARARIEAYFADPAGGEVEEEFAFERRGEGSFRRIFSNVSRDFRFRVHCGDFHSGWYTVAVRSRPRIEEIAVTFDYPDYTGLDEAGGIRSLETGHLKVPSGTVVHYTARTSIAVREAARVETRRSGDGEWRDEQTLEIVDGRELAGSFTAEQDGTYFFRLVSEDGFENPTPIRYRIAVIEDQPPGVQVIQPGRDLELTARATFPLAMHLSDDYGIESAGVFFFPENELEGEPIRRVPIALDSAGSDPANAGEVRKLLPELTLELTEWGLAPGMRLEYVVRATDAIGQVGESRSWLLSIIDEDELRDDIESATTQVREVIRDTFELQREARRGVEELEERARLEGGKLPEEARPGLRHQRMAQERVNRRMDDAVEQFQELIDRVVQNRLTDYQDLPWLQELRDRLGELREQSADPALEQLDALTEEEDSSKIAPSDLREAADRMRSSELGLQQMADELEEWTDVQSIIRSLEDLLKQQDEVEATVREHIRGTLGDSPSEEDRGGN